MGKAKKKTKTYKQRAYELYGTDDFIIALAATGIILMLAGYFIIRATH